MISREQVYALINEERHYQNRKNLNMGRSIGDELTLLRKYLRDAENAFANTFDDPQHEQPTMDVVRKIAAICIRAMEMHGAPHRQTE